MLREARARYANQGVMIRGEATLAYQDLADVLSACDRAGIRNVRLPVRSRGEGAAASSDHAGPMTGTTSLRPRQPTVQADAIRPHGAHDGIAQAAPRHVLHLNPES